MKLKVTSDPESPTLLARLLRTLPPGRRRVAQALLARSASRTYPAVAAYLGIHLGTVHQHLRRIRLRHPHVYVMIMAARARQLAERHERAEQRAASALVRTDPPMLR